jgi:hypothetical protein
MNTKLTTPKDTGTLPFTLREALNLPEPTSIKKAVPCTGLTMDLTIAKLQDLANQAKKDFVELSNSQYTHQGLALNKISNLQTGLEELILSLQSDVE